MLPRADDQLCPGVAMICWIVFRLLQAANGTETVHYYVCSEPSFVFLTGGLTEHGVGMLIMRSNKKKARALIKID